MDGLQNLGFFFDKMKEQKGFKSSLSGITAGVLTLNPSEVVAKFLLPMSQKDGKFASEVGT